MIPTMLATPRLGSELASVVDVLLASRQNQCPEACSRGDENVIHLGAFWVHVGAHQGKC